MAGLLGVRNDVGDMRLHRHLLWLLREEVEAGRRRGGLFGGRSQHEDLPRRNVADSEVSDNHQSNDCSIHHRLIIIIRCSFISGISLLGTPTEVYIYGIHYLYIMGGIITMGFIMSYVYLPVFHDLKLTSTYQVRMCSLIRAMYSIS